MSRILSANFMRLKKNKSFWSGVIFMFCMGIFCPVKSYMDTLQTNWIHTLDSQLYFCALLVDIVMAEFCSMFIGTEYSDGTMRNKIIVGRRRRDIYLANVLTSSIVSVIMCIAFILPYLSMGIPLLGFFTADINMILVTGAAVLLLAVAFSAVFTLIAMVYRNKAVAVVVCMLLSFGFLLTGGILQQMLEAPKMVSMYSMSIDGSLVNTEMPNPKYLEGIKREIVQAVYDIVPGGQAVQCAMLTAVNLPRLPFYSLGVILLTSGFGFVLFRKSDLR